MPLLLCREQAGWHSCRSWPCQDLSCQGRGAPRSLGCRGARDSAVLQASSGTLARPEQLGTSSQVQSWHVPCLVCGMGQGKVSSETWGQIGPESPRVAESWGYFSFLYLPTAFISVISLLPIALPEVGFIQNTPFMCKETISEVSCSFFFTDMD